MAEASLKKTAAGAAPSGDVNVTDRCARLLGQLCVANSPIDPRAIRALNFLTDSVNVSGSNVNATILGTPNVDVTDRVGRLLGIVNSITNPVDVSDRATRLLGIIYGNLTQLQQRAITNELLVQLAAAGVQYDARDRNWDLDFASDQVDASGSTVTATISGTPNVNVTDREDRELGLVTMKDAFMELRLMADYLKDLPLALDPTTSRVREKIESIDSGVTLPIVTTVSTVTNLSQIGGTVSNSLVFDTMDIAWNTGIRINII
jgi:hypothetical protein